MNLANRKSDLAEDFYKNAINSIHEVETQSKNFFEKKDLEALLKVVHKFHGSVCYTGLPLLKKATYELETQLKKNGLEQSETIYNNFVNELQHTKTASEAFVIPDPA